MNIVVSIQQRIARLQAQASATKTTADASQQTSEIVFVTMAENGAIDEVTATEHMDAFAAWQPNVNYTAGQMRVHGEVEGMKLYRCIQSHTSQPGWTPDTTPALWSIAGDPAEEWPEWSQPLAAHDAYDKGAKVSHGGKHWVSDVGANVWEPGVYGWGEAL